jgi:diaminopimelate epimerase
VSVSFSKYEGLGNDFILVDGSTVPALTPPLAKALCDRHFGIGADGVLVTGLNADRPFMHVINADGSEPEMCGNGLRCVALYLVQRGLVQAPTFEIDTDAGVHEVSVAVHGEAGHVRVVMRPASLAAGDVLHAVEGEFLDHPFEVDGTPLSFSMVSMGNPHAVTFDPVADRVDALGPRIERDPRFRAGANVGFASLRDPDVIDLRVWERGCGFTLACGTGACAAAVAAVETGRASRGRPITVHLPGGALSIRVGERTAARTAPVEMTGPARRVFDGQIAWPREMKS